MKHKAQSDWGSAPNIPGITLSGSMPSPDPDAEKQRRIEFFDNLAAPLLRECARKDKEAVARAIDSIHGHFEGYRAGVKPLADDLTSWGTRWGLFKRTVTDWVNEEHESVAYANAKFREHLFDEEKLNGDLSGVLTALKSDLEASQSMLLVECGRYLTEYSIRGIHLPDLHDISSEITAQLESKALPIGHESLKNFLVSQAGSQVATSAAVALLRQVAIRVAASSTVSVLSSGGAAAASSAAGAGTGSMLGPAGTIIGLGVGFVVGVAVDWWQTNSFREKITISLTDYLAALEKDLRVGSDESPGLEAVLTELLKAYEEAQWRVLQAAIIQP